MNRNKKNNTLDDFMKVLDNIPERTKVNPEDLDPNKAYVIFKNENGDEVAQEVSKAAMEAFKSNSFISPSPQVSAGHFEFMHLARIDMENEKEGHY